MKDDAPAPLDGGCSLPLRQRQIDNLYSHETSTLLFQHSKIKVGTIGPW